MTIIAISSVFLTAILAYMFGSYRKELIYRKKLDEANRITNKKLKEAKEYAEKKYSDNDINALNDFLLTKDNDDTY